MPGGCGDMLKSYVFRVPVGVSDGVRAREGDRGWSARSKDGLSECNKSSSFGTLMERVLGLLSNVFVDMLLLISTLTSAIEDLVDGGLSTRQKSINLYTMYVCVQQDRERYTEHIVCQHIF